jgi:hypothetical protein
VAATCLVNGRHTPGSEWERECPLRNAAKRSERSRRAAQTVRERSRTGVDDPGAGQGVPEAGVDRQTESETALVLA